MPTFSSSLTKKDVVEEHVERTMRNSDCRSPVIFIMKDGDPLSSLQILAKKTKSTIWTFDLSINADYTNIMDYIEVGSKNGDWVYVSRCDVGDVNFFRDVARELYNMKPEAQRYVRRELFRAVFSVLQPFPLNDISRAPFPQLFLQNAILGRHEEATSKWVRPLPADMQLRVEAIRKHERRRAAGRDSDSESDREGDPVTGMWFHRSSELSKFIDNSQFHSAVEAFAQALYEQDTDTMRQLYAGGEIRLDRVLKSGMTPLQLACCMHLTDSAVLLLELGADPNAPRGCDGCPPLFMAIDDVNLAKVLLDSGADPFQNYRSCRADNYYYTHPDVCAYIKERRLEM